MNWFFSAALIHKPWFKWPLFFYLHLDTGDITLLSPVHSVWYARTWCPCKGRWRPLDASGRFESCKRLQDLFFCLWGRTQIMEWDTNICYNQPFLSECGNSSSFNGCRIILTVFWCRFQLNNKKHLTFLIHENAILLFKFLLIFATIILYVPKDWEHFKIFFSLKRIICWLRITSPGQ